MNNARSKFKKDYVRILESGPVSSSDNQLAKELIDANYAQGQCLVSKSRDHYGEVTSLVGFQINTNGRLFLDELTKEITKESWFYRTKIFGIWAFGGICGLVGSLLSGLGVEFLKNYLPK